MASRRYAPCQVTSLAGSGLKLRVPATVTSFDPYGGPRARSPSAGLALPLLCVPGVARFADSHPDYLPQSGSEPV
jgi:hypothetical protein